MTGISWAGIVLGVIVGLLLCGRKSLAGGGGKGGEDRDPILVGYSYYMAAIFGLCLSASKLLKIVYGEKVAWSGTASAGNSLLVDAGGLFGGENTGGSGGLKGTFYFNDGAAAQERDPVVNKFLGADSPAYRGIVTLSMDSSYVASFSPNFRALRCLVQNLGYAWYPQKATIAGTQVNPAHEIREALINPDLSGQFIADDIDDASFKAAADILYAENFGLSPKWDDASKAQEYIQSLLTHIDGLLVRDRSTGKMQLRLLRGGYDVDALPVVGQRDFTALSSLGTVAFSAMQNKITIKYARMTDIGEETGTITGENQANIELQEGRVNATEITYTHLTDAIPDLAGRILARELRSRSYPLKSFTLKGLSHLSQFQEGDLFVFSFPEQGIEKLVCRVLEADYGTLDEHQVTLTCTEDIYSVNSAVISGAQTEWEDVLHEPSVPSLYEMQEAPLYIADKRAKLTRAQWKDEYPKVGFVLSLAQKNVPTDYSYSHRILTQNLWEDAGDGSFVSSAVLTHSVGKTTTIFSLGDTSSLALRLGDIAFIGQEILEVIGWSGTGITVHRGMLDTLPQAYEQGVRVWLPSSTGGGFCWRMFPESETARIALATRNSLGSAAVTSADRIATTMRARAFRPYPPAGLSFNGAYLPEEFEGKLTVSWKHRDRWQQIDTLVTQQEANVGPEEGVTYNLKVYDENDTLKKNLTGLTGTSWTWDTETADCDFTALSNLFSTETIYGAGTSLSRTSTVNLEAGDVLLAWVFHTAAVSLPAGWLLQATAEGTDGTSTVFISLYSKTITAASTLGTLEVTQNAAGNMGLFVQGWRLVGGAITISATTTQNQNSVTSRNVIWAAHPAPAKECLTLIGGVSTYAHSSYTAWTASAGTIMSTVKLSNNRLVCGKITQGAGEALAGYYQFDDSARLIGTASIAVSLLVPANIIPREYNRTVRVELEAMREGYTSWQKWNHSATRPDVTPPDVGYGYNYGNDYGA